MTASRQLASVLGLEVPIVCAPMGGISGGRLASAVSRCGALGMIGMGSAGSVPLLERELAELHVDDVPFGIGLVDWVMARDEALLVRALEARPRVLAVSFATWSLGTAPTHDWVARAKEIGTVTATQVATAAEAERAAAAGIELIVVRGSEAGGHGDPRQSLNSVFEETIARINLPVLAAGAISSRAELQAFLDRGAAGAWVGTAFAACPESLATDAARDVMLRARGKDTLVTHALDAALGYPWPTRFPERVIATDFIRRWHGREPELRADAAALAEFRAAAGADDHSIVPLDAGLGVDALTEILPAARVVDALRVREVREE